MSNRWPGRDDRHVDEGGERGEREQRGPATEATRLPVRLDLAGGGVLTVRPIEPSDVEAVRELHERLSPEAVYLRFFTSTLPAAPFFDRLATVVDRGGVGLVAIAEPSDGSGSELVAEVDVERLANGNGEIAIVVDARWRGWLGPYLVELATREAARRGMPNLEAEILSCNRPMRAITRSRGEAILPASDWQELRVAFSTAGPAPTWPASGDGPRILLEQRGVAFGAVSGLQAAGFDVVACAGRTSGRPSCPLLAGGECPLASGADAIVIAMPAGEERDELEAAHRAASSPVVVVEPGTRSPLTADALVAAARSIVGASDLDVGADLEHPIGRQVEEA